VFDELIFAFNLSITPKGIEAIIVSSNDLWKVELTPMLGSYNVPKAILVF
jgi:hypothetical protein